MKKYHRRPEGFLRPPWLWLTVVLIVTAVATAASSSIAAAKTTTNIDAPTTGTTTTIVNDDDDDNGIFDSVIPFKALQLYNTLAGYMEYIYDMITGQCFPLHFPMPFSLGITKLFRYN